MNLNNSDLKQLKKEIRKRQNEFGENIYHYTSMAALISMVNNRELWLSNTGTMNDRKETIYFIEKIEQELSSYDKKEFFESIYKTIPFKYQYAMSFSTEKDDAAQWERYADAAAGACISFNVRELTKCLYGYKDFMFDRVRYPKDVKEHDYYKMVKEYFETGNMEPYKDQNELVNSLILAGNLHKHPSFKLECEVRLTSRMENNMAGMAYEYKEKAGVIKKVLVLKPDTMGSDKDTGFVKIIDEIILGPKCQQNINVLQEYMNTKGLFELGNVITQSQCPLR